MAKYQDFLSRVGSNRDRTALRGIFSMFLTDDNPPKLKDLELASIILSGAETTQISITGAFTTGISIAADGTTAIAVTSAFSGVTGLSFAGTASGDGILISGACADALHISGTNTATAIHISGDQVIGILMDVDAAWTDGLKILVDDGITLTTGINIDRSGTTGICTTAISIDTDGTTGIEIAAGFTGTTGILIAGTASADGISITGVCADGIHVSGAMTAAGIHVSGDQVAGFLFDSTAAADAAYRAAIPTGITLGIGVDINCTSTGVVTSGLTMQGTGTFTTGITLSATAITTGMLISATTVTTGITISSACSGDGILVSGACADAIHISGTNTVSGLHISGDQVLAILIDVDAAATAGIQIKVDDGITADYGIDISRTGTTGICTTGIRIDTDGTTGIDIATGFTGATAIALQGTGSTAGINISGNHTTAITIGVQTTAGIAITGATATGISITGVCSTAAVQIGVSGTPAGDFVWYGTTAAYAVTFDANGDTNGSVLIGADTKGLMFNLYGDVTGCGVFWDPTTDTNGTLSVGASGGSKGNDVFMYGNTNGAYCQWDQSANALALFGTAAILSDATKVRTPLGTTPVGTVTIAEYGDGRDITTVLTLTNFIVGALAGAGAALGIGNIVYAFPAGQHLELVSALSSIVLTAAGTAVATDTGLASVIASGAIALLSTGGATMEDRLTGQTINTAAGGGAAVSALLAATAGIGTGISLNVAASVKNVFLNSAGTWNANNTGNLTATGTIVLKWTRMG